MNPPFALVTLLAILETSSEAWWRLASMTGQLLVRLEQSLPPMEDIVATLGELHRECERLKLTTAVLLLERIRDDAIGGAAGSPISAFAEKLRPMVADLNLRVWDELRGRFFLTMPSGDVALYKQTEPLFGDVVAEKFPHASEDISEAGKSISLGRYTASVFHLMRAMEIAVKALGLKLAVTVVDKDNVDLEWGKIVANLRGPVDQMPKGGTKEKWSEAIVLLVHVKQAWRNPTMHPKQTYTEEEAKEIFSSARSFMRFLSSLV